jgi:hypothetical protein
MTRVFYTLTNGQRVETFKEAIMSGQGYTTSYEPVVNKPSKLTEKQEARRVLATLKTE